MRFQWSPFWLTLRKRPASIFGFGDTQSLSLSCNPATVVWSSQSQIKNKRKHVWAPQTVALIFESCIILIWHSNTVSFFSSTWKYIFKKCLGTIRKQQTWLLSPGCPLLSVLLSSCAPQLSVYLTLETDDFLGILATLVSFISSLALVHF